MRPVLMAVLTAMLFAAPVRANESHHTVVAQSAAAQTSARNEGEIRKVDKSAKKLTIKHGPLVKLEMPAMTMVFQVKDPAMLEQVKAGDRVRFDAERVGGVLVVTKIEAAP